MNPFTITIQIPETSVLALGELITAANKHGCSITELAPGNSQSYNPVLAAIAKGVNQINDDINKLKNGMQELETLVLEGFTAPNQLPQPEQPCKITAIVHPAEPAFQPPAVTEESSVAATTNVTPNKIKILDIEKISKPQAILLKDKLPTNAVPAAIRWNNDLWVNRKQFASKLGISIKTFDRRAKSVPFVQYGVIFDDVPVKFYSVANYIPAAENPSQDIIFESKDVIDLDTKAGPEELKIETPAAPKVKKAFQLELPTNNSSVRDVMDFVQHHGGTTEKHGRCVVLKHKNKTHMIAEKADHIPKHVLSFCRAMADA